MTTETLPNLETLCAWRKPRRVNTRFGPRILHTANVTEEFWTAWNANKEGLKKAGLSIKRDQQGKWEVMWWEQISQEEQERRADMEAASYATDANVSFPSPEGLDYRPFQRAGIAFAMRNTGTLIGDEMGLGKTIQAIGVINSDPKIHRVLIVTKASLKLNWKREVEKWLTRKLTVEVADGKLWPKSDIVVVNYDITRKWPKALAFMWDLIVLDECHYIKNPKAKRTISIVGQSGNKKKGILPTSGIPARRKLALTGTPMENNPGEIYTILHYLNPEEWGSFWSFAKRYCGMTYNGFGYDFSGATNLDELRTRLRQTTMVRRLKKDVLTELPPKTRQVIELDPSGMGVALQEEMDTVKKFTADLEKAQAAAELASAIDNEEEYRKAVSELQNSYRIAFTEIARVRHETAVAKVDKAVAFLLEMSEEIDKIIIFAHHSDVIKAVKEALNNSELGRRCVTLTGSDSPQVRQQAVDSFQDDPKVGWFIGSIRAAGEGITLTAASHVVFLEEDWVPSKMSQCEDRAHRMGQKDNVNVYHLVVEGSLDVKMAKTAIEKQIVFDQALDTGKEPTYDAAPVFVPKHKPAATRPELQLKAASMTKEERWAVHQGLKLLAGMDYDHAAQLNDMGFSKVDVCIGHSLAEQDSLSPLQGALGYKLIVKYHRQLPEVILTTAGVEPKQTKKGKRNEQ